MEISLDNRIDLAAFFKLSVPTLGHSLQHSRGRAPSQKSSSLSSDL